MKKAMVTIIIITFFIRFSKGGSGQANPFYSPAVRISSGLRVCH